MGLIGHIQLNYGHLLYTVGGTAINYYCKPATFQVRYMLGYTEQCLLVCVLDY